MQENSKVILVTGASSGFGLLACKTLAKKGYRVVATMRNLAKKEELEAWAIKEGLQTQISYSLLDVTNEENIHNTVQHIIDQYGQIDVLVNNAGVAYGGFVEEIKLETWKKQFDTNVFGLVAVTKAVLPFMRMNKKGTIINISSISGLYGFPGLSPYVSSKHAIEGFSESLRLEVKPFGIHVSLVEPGSYKTEIWDKSLAEIYSEANSPYNPLMKKILANVTETAKNAGDPQEVVDTIVKIIETPNPDLRYPVGKGVKSGIFLKKALPWKWLEKIISNQLR